MKPVAKGRRQEDEKRVADLLARIHDDAEELHEILVRNRGWTPFVRVQVPVSKLRGATEQAGRKWDDALRSRTSQQKQQPTV